MVLTILSGVTLVILGFIGFFRGIRRGLIALAGTLLGAVLIDLWRSHWLASLNAADQPALISFLLIASVFWVVAIIVGYGGSLMLPAPSSRAKAPNMMVERLLGSLLGTLNGALITSYTLRYAHESWPDEAFASRVADAFIARELDSWLPWFVSAMVMSTMLFVLIRGTVRIMRALNPPVPVSPIMGKSPMGMPPSGAPARKAAPPSQPTPPPATGATHTLPKSSAEVERILLEKIMESRGEKK